MRRYCKSAISTLKSSICNAHCHSGFCLPLRPSAPFAVQSRSAFRIPTSAFAFFASRHLSGSATDRHRFHSVFRPFISRFSPFSPFSKTRQRGQRPQSTVPNLHSAICNAPTSPLHLLTSSPAHSLIAFHIPYFLPSTSCSPPLDTKHLTRTYTAPHHKTKHPNMNSTRQITTRRAPSNSAAQLGG